MREIFSDLHPEHLVGILEEKRVTVWRPPLRLGPQEIFSLKLVHVQTPTASQLPFRSRTCCCCHLPFLLWASSDSLYLPFSPVSRAVFCPGPQFSDGSKEGGWFPHCSGFFLLWGQEWQLPQSWHVGSKITHHLFLYNSELKAIFSFFKMVGKKSKEEYYFMASKSYMNNKF